MSSKAEDISANHESSIRDGVSPAARLAAACAALAGQGDASVPAILAAAIDALEAERAFVVRLQRGGDESAQQVEALLSVRGDGIDTPSRTLLRWAALGEAASHGVDLALQDAGIECPSVRALALRSVLSARIPSLPPVRRALVLDSREMPVPIAPERLLVLEGFAALLSVAMDRAAVVSRAPIRAERADSGIVGRSPAFRELLRVADRVAPWRLPVLVTGESGSGKEEIARRLHALGPRRSGSFIAINCAALTETLLESELFGAVRGAYTGAEQDRPGLFRLAQGGTLFLDEVGDMPAAMQAKLLRVLQDSKVRPVGGKSEIAVDARVVAATHHDLSHLVAQGRFRSDLFYRLAVIELRVPPLRDRREDIPALVEHLVGRLQAATGIASIRVSACAVEALRDHSWPGNVRELESALARGLTRSTDGTIAAAHLDFHRTGRGALGAAPTEPTYEQTMIESALLRTGGNLTRAAALIGWSRPKLYRRMTVHGLTRPPRGEVKPPDPG